MQHYGSAFKVPLLDQWMVIVSGPNMVDELRKRPEEELSVMDGLLEVRPPDSCFDGGMAYQERSARSTPMDDRSRI